MAGVAGREYPPVAFRIEADHVAAFAEAIGADPSRGVPATYAAVYALGTTAPQLFRDPDAAIDLAVLVHAEQEFEWSRHPRVGETVVAQARVADDQERRGLRMVSLETRCTVEGQPLCVSRMLSVIRSR